MQTTTIYRETLTITTDDDGTVTTSRSHSAHTRAALLFEELSPEAQQRAIRDAIEEEDDPGNWYCSQSYFSEEEIWQAAHDLEKQQPIRFYSDAGCSPAAEARAWTYDPHADRHHGFWGDAYELVSMAEDNGVCFSMDICDKWNEYAPRIIALCEGYDEAAERAYIHDENADSAADNGDPETAEAERRRAAFYEDMTARIDEAASDLVEEAARACGDVVDGLIEAERDYYHSAEFWREWLNDGETRFTREGERI